MQSTSWYNEKSVAFKGSTILTAWKDAREAARAAAVPAVKNAAHVYTSSNPAVIELFGGVSASSGYQVNETTAMRVSAVHACIQLLGGIIASLPLDVHQRNSDGDGDAKDDGD